ncbi:unnamed protein product, partial [Adineta ricciae]
LAVNGGFETGNLNGWVYRTSGSACLLNKGQAYSDSWPSSNHAHSGTYYYYDRCSGGCDVIQQSFVTVPGNIYIISFYLTNYVCCGATSIAGVTFS